MFGAFFCTTVLKKQTSNPAFATGGCGEPNKKKQLKRCVEKQVEQTVDLGFRGVSLPSVVWIMWKNRRHSSD